MTFWLPRQQPNADEMSKQIAVGDVLYFYDEPLIFLSNFLESPVFCYKYAEDDEGELSYYIAAPTNDRLVGALKAGRVSLRGMLSVPSLWIYEADPFGNVGRWWACSIDDIPDVILPIKNVGLRPEFGSVPDQLTIRRKDAPFMSVNFLGGSLHAGEINLIDFKNLLDSTYSCLRDIIRRALLDNGSADITVGQLERMLTIPFRQPHLSSLQLDIGRPVIEEHQIRDRAAINIKKIDTDIDRYRGNFLNVARTIGAQATERRFSIPFARENIQAIENLLGIIPNEETVFQVVEIVSEDSDQRPIRIEAGDGQKIFDAYKIVQRERRYIEGHVVEVNFRSDTFIIKNDVGREITCVVPLGWTGQRPRRAGEQIRLFGRLQKRKRRDLFLIDREDIEF